MLLRSLHIASRQLFYLIVIGIILSLLGLIGAVWLSEEVAKRKDEIAAWASDKTGYPITVESAGLYWFDLIPKLEVRQVALLHNTSHKAVATADQIYLTLDILASLEQGEPVVADASIDGVEMAIERDSEGQLRLTGLASGGRRFSGTTLPQALRWFSWLKQLELSNIDIAYTDQTQALISGAYLLQQAELTFSENLWQASAQLQLPEHLGHEVNFSGQAEIDSDYTLTSWQGKLLSEDILLAPLLAEQSLNGALISSGKVSLVLEAAQQGSGNSSADLNLLLSDVIFASDQAGQVYEKVVLNSLQGRLSWKSQGQTWQLQSDGLKLQVADVDWPMTQFNVIKTADGLINAQTNYLRLSDFTALSLLLKNMPEPLLISQPAGDIYDLALNYQLDSGLQTLQFRAEDIAMLPWQDYPGVNGLGFELAWEQGAGQLLLDSHELTVYADAWLDESVYLDSLTGKLSWRLQDDNWHAVAEELSLWNQDLSLQLDGRINHQSAVTDTDLTLTMQDVVINRWKAYVPQKVLPADFKKWSDNAFKEGLIKTGKILMRGDPAAFPFDESPSQGVFDMQLQVENAQLHYAPDWPDIINVNASISGQGNNLIIKSRAGKIADFAFNNVTTTISNLVRPNPILKVDGLLNGTTKQALSFLQNSPLEERFGSIAEWIQADGKSDIQLELMVPLINTNATDVTGHVTFADSNITTTAVPDLVISKVNGQLSFNNDGVTAKQIKAVVLDEPVVANVETDNGQTVVSVKGKANMRQLNVTWPGTVPDFVSGQADYQTSILIREPQEGVFDVGVEIESDLVGVVIDTPEPLTKTAQQSKKLQLSINQNKLGQVFYQASYDDWLDSALSFADSDISGQVMLGGEKAKYAKQGLHVAGSLAELDLDKWVAWQSSRTDKENSQAIDIKEVNVDFDKLILAQQAITDVQLAATQNRTEWQVQLDSPQIKGQLGIPHESGSSQPLDIKLAYLKLKLPQNKPEQGTPASSRELWPSMRLDIAELELDGLRLGQLNLRAKRSAEQWMLESASLQSPVMNASATGRWSKTNSVDDSQFNIVVSSHDLKALLAYYDYQQAIEAKHVQLIANLDWSGDPLAFTRQTLGGELDLTVGRGSLIEVEPGAAGRIFGLLSIAAIPRRLSLDFSDLFGKGFDFSAINGTFSFANGIARTDDLAMQGDSAVIEVKGPVDMINKTYNQVVRVTPKVSSTLPLAGAVAGGPVGLGVGTAILIFDKLAGTLFDREIVNLITYSYKLTGPWDNPKLNILNPATN